MIKAQETVTDAAMGETKVRTSSRPTHPHRKRIPISAAQRIAEEYGYDQVLIYARKVDQPSRPGGEHVWKC